MLVNKLDSFFSCIAAQHINILSYGTGDRWEIAVNGRDDYPRLWLQQIFQNRLTLDGRTRWRVQFLIMDLGERDESDELQHLDQTHTIARQVIEFINQSEEYSLEGEANLVSFTEFSDDCAVGWAVELDLLEVNPVDRCNIDDVFKEVCDYLLISQNIFDSYGPGGYITGVVIDGVFNGLNQPYNIIDPGGALELERLKADIEALGYTVETNYTGSTLSLIVRATQSVFSLLTGVKTQARGLPDLNVQFPFVVNCDL